MRENTAHTVHDFPLGRRQNHNSLRPEARALDTNLWEGHVFYKHYTVVLTLSHCGGPYRPMSRSNHAILHFPLLLRSVDMQSKCKTLQD